MLEKGKDDSNKLMGDSQDCLSIRFSFGSFFGIKGVEDWVYSYDSNGHEEEDAAKAFVTTFRDMASAFPLSGLIDSGVKAGIGNEFLPGGEGTVVGFGQEVRDSGLIKSWDGAEDLELVWELGLARMDKACCYLFEFYLQVLEEADFGAEDSFKVLRGEADRGLGQLAEELALVIDQGSLKAVLGDIEAAKIDSHWFTSSNIIRAEAGEASRSILHSDKGSWTQSTYQDSGRQRTDSFEGSRAQVEWSSPASSLLSYSLDKLINNINY
jgi:hypothetical protein